MILASHYVIRDIMYTLKSENISDLERLCKKYTNRYKNDEQLSEVCGHVLRSISEETYDDEINEILLKLEELLSVRKMNTSGGSDLWFTNRRKRL